MKKIIALLLCLIILAVPVGALAESVQPAQPFGVDLVPLRQDELEEVDGEWQGIAAAAAFGAAFGTYDYLTTTSRDEWSWGGAALSAFNGAISGAGGAWVGSLF